ncbi:sulfotransferase family protein [Alicyclobacillus fastidiosus]|uniref:Sulfotransferase n=1 Tax=Alicyclobacillus fastidiosus TaxID=392011 RepID=A0ABV5AD47_9BACL|nr:sulfotransferase [Alicyclobacillus fastidiosus]WEH08777.1 sulfotransferase [Alicyclobacillus fastidiosus]
MARLPNFFIAGAAKSGTTSLFHYVQAHPDVFMSRVKEPHYFCSPEFPDRFEGPGDQGFQDNTMRKLDDYMHLFDGVQNESIVGEASVYYLTFPQVAARIHQFNPDAKIVFILRNPVQRAFSAYMHTIRDGRETLSFEEALEQEATRKAQNYQPLWWYKEAGLYAQSVEAYMSVFGRDQLKIFLYEDLKHADQVVRELFAFLNLRDDVPVDTSLRHNQSGKPKSRAMYEFFAKPNAVKEVIKPFLPKDFRHKLGQRAKSMTLAKDKPSAKTERMLQRYFRDDVLRLQDLLHRDLSGWLS